MKKSKRGRPSKWKDEFVETVYKLTLLGLIDEDIADVLGISLRAYNSYKKSNAEFSQAIKKGKQIADANVVEKLYNRANGYKYEEKKIKDGVVVETIIKHMPPDTTAMIYWLKNRQKEHWRDRIEQTNVNVDTEKAETVNDIWEIIDNGKLPTPKSSK
jgi:transcriptional regulator with XRE-family HTH domain